MPPPPGFSDIRYVEGEAGQKIEMVNAAGADAGADSAPAAQRRAPPPPANDSDDFGLTVRDCR